MKITKAFASLEDGYPVLDLEIDGHPTHVLEPKQTLLDRDIVILLDSPGYWAKAIHVDTAIDGNRVILRGATQDPDVLAIVRRFVAGEEGDLLATHAQ